MTEVPEVPESPETAEVSVVVTHYDAPDRLALVLAGLAAQTLPADRFEVVVADDGSPVAPVLPPQPYALRLVAQEDDGFRAAAARNLGAAAGTGRVLCFLDGDTVPEPGYLAAVLAETDATAAADLAAPGGTGEVLVVGRRRHADLAGWTPARLSAWFAGTGGAPEELEEPRWLVDGFRWTDDLRAADDESYRWVIAAVLSMHRSLFERVGGFEPSFRAYGGEDWEIANRCWLAGAQLRHVPGAVAWHDGVDFAGREVDRRAVQNAQAATLATLLPSPATRPPGPVWASPLVVVEVDDRGWTPEQALLTMASLLRAGDVGVWLRDGAVAAEGAPLADDPRVRAGEVPAPVLLRCRARVRVTAPVELVEPLADLVARAPVDLPGVRVRHARD
ncbi:glycosyltransferase family 2 protein, partial [Aquipuribacter hungaricus]